MSQKHRRWINAVRKLENVLEVLREHPRGNVSDEETIISFLGHIFYICGILTIDGRKAEIWIFEESFFDP